MQFAVSATIALRLALIIVPVMSQRLVAKQSKYKKELDEFRTRLEDARKEGNNLLRKLLFMKFAFMVLYTSKVASVLPWLSVGRRMGLTHNVFQSSKYFWSKGIS